MTKIKAPECVVYGCDNQLLHGGQPCVAHHFNSRPGPCCRARQLPPLKIEVGGEEQEAVVRQCPGCKAALIWAIDHWQLI